MINHDDCDNFIQVVTANMKKQAKHTSIRNFRVSLIDVSLTYGLILPLSERESEL